MTTYTLRALRATFAGVLGLSLLLSTYVAESSAQAQQKKRQPRVIQLEEIVIEGRVQKPNAFYILNRSNLGYEVLELRTTFLRDVIRSVQEEPF
ncbi:MAG: hypothetical protein AAF500_09630 [Myxococcota bacterium]